MAVVIWNGRSKITATISESQGQDLSFLYEEWNFPNTFSGSGV